MAGRVNASARNSTSGSTSLTSAISQCQKFSGLVCGLSTRKILTPCADPVQHDPQDLRRGCPPGRCRSSAGRCPGTSSAGSPRRRCVPSGAGGEPLRVLGDPRVVRRALQRQVHRDLQAVLVRRPRRTRGSPPSVPSSRVDRVVAALVGADRPRRADVVRPGDQRVVAALAVDPADRVDRRQVEHVEAHRGDAPGSRSAAVAKVPCLIGRRRPADHGALGAREELVPGGEQRPLAVDPDRVRRGSVVTSSRTGCSQSSSARSSAGETRANSERSVVAQRGGRAADPRPARRPARSWRPGRARSAPSARSLARSSSALPGADLLGHRVAPGQVRVVERLDGEGPPRRPRRAGSCACQRSVPGLARAHPGERAGARRRGRARPRCSRARRGPRGRTRAETGTARRRPPWPGSGRRTPTGVTSSMGKRPVMISTVVSRARTGSATGEYRTAVRAVLLRCGGAANGARAVRSTYRRALRPAHPGAPSHRRVRFRTVPTPAPARRPAAPAGSRRRDRPAARRSHPAAARQHRVAGDGPRRRTRRRHVATCAQGRVGAAGSASSGGRSVRFIGQQPARLQRPGRRPGEARPGHARRHRRTVEDVDHDHVVPVGLRHPPRLAGVPTTTSTVGRPRQGPGDQREQQAVALHHLLRGPGPRRGHPAGQRQPAAARDARTVSGTPEAGQPQHGAQPPRSTRTPDGADLPGRRTTGAPRRPAVSSPGPGPGPAAAGRAVGDTA